MPPSNDTPRFRINREISVANILTAISMIIALLVAWNNIQVRLSVLEQRVNDLVVAVNRQRINVDVQTDKPFVTRSQSLDYVVK